MITPSEVNQVIESLQDLGRNGSINYDGKLPDKETARKGTHVGKVMIGSMQKEPLGALIRGMVLFWKRTNTFNGSVSLLHRYYIQYVTRFPEDDHGMTQWILENRDNEYDPFGTIVESDASSYQEFLQIKRVKAEMSKQHIALNEVAHRARLQRDLKKIEVNLPKAIARNDGAAVAAMQSTQNEIRSYFGYCRK